MLSKYQYMRKCAKRLQSMGLECAKTKSSVLEVSNGARVIIKVCQKINHTGTDLFVFWVGRRSGVCDAYVVYCVDGDKEKVYIFPESAVCERQNISIAEEYSKWEDYRDAWDVIAKGKTRTFDRVDKRRRQFRPDARATTLCWGCKNACGGCSWTEWDVAKGATRFQPVEGWVAEQTELLSYCKGATRKTTTSYRVIACPLYVKG